MRAANLNTAIAGLRVTKEWLILSATSDSKKAMPPNYRKRRVRFVRFATRISADMEVRRQYFQESVSCTVPPHVQTSPARLVRKGKVPSALVSRAGGRNGLARGDIQVASLSCQLDLQRRCRTAADVAAVVKECKHRVTDQFGFKLGRRSAVRRFLERS